MLSDDGCFESSPLDATVSEDALSEVEPSAVEPSDVAVSDDAPFGLFSSAVVPPNDVPSRWGPPAD